MQGVSLTSAVASSGSRKLIVHAAIVALALCRCAASNYPPQPIPQIAVPGCTDAATPVCTLGGESSARFVLVGDTGDANSKHLPRTLAGIAAAADFDAILLLGDNGYECGFDGADDPLWQKVVAPLMRFERPVFPVLGNHDYGARVRFACRFSNPAAQIVKSGTAGYENWRFPARNYVVRHPLIEVIMVDTTPVAENWPETHEATRHVAEAVAKPKTTPWRAVVGHHVIETCGRTGRRDERERMRAIVPLLEHYDVDFYISGHDHHLEVGAGETPWYVISGAGSRLRSRRQCPGRMPARNTTGFMTLEVTESQATITTFCNDSPEPCLQKVLER